MSGKRCDGHEVARSTFWRWERERLRHRTNASRYETEGGTVDCIGAFCNPERCHGYIGNGHIGNVPWSASGNRFLNGRMCPSIPERSSLSIR